MVQRTRTMSGETISGQLSSAGAVYTRKYSSMSKRFTDVVASGRGDHPASSATLTKRGGLWNGDTSEYYWAHGAPCSFYVSYAGNHSVIPGIPSLQSVFLEGLSRANPATPTVGLPLALAELRDLPRMLLARYRTKRGPSNSVVENSFGWSPLISDIRKLFTFPHRVEMRLRTLKALISKGDQGISRSIKVAGGDVETHWPSYSVDTTYGWSCTTQLRKRTSTDFVVTSHWRGVSDLSTFYGGDTARLAANLVLGLEPHQLIDQAWQLLPWSWAADWFLNLSSWLQAHNSAIAVSANEGTVSQVTISDLATARSYANGFPSSKDRVLSRGSIRYRTWERTVHSKFLPAFEVPYLSTSQVLTLSSIAFNNGRG